MSVDPPASLVYVHYLRLLNQDNLMVFFYSIIYLSLTCLIVTVLYCVNVKENIVVVQNGYFC